MEYCFAWINFLIVFQKQAIYQRDKSDKSDLGDKLFFIADSARHATSTKICLSISDAYGSLCFIFFSDYKSMAIGTFF
jgi:hypothetical protein